MCYVRVKWNVTILVCSWKKTCSLQGHFSPGAVYTLQPEPPDPMSAGESHACRHQLRTVTAGLVTLQVTEQALVVPGCFLAVPWWCWSWVTCIFLRDLPHLQQLPRTMHMGQEIWDAKEEQILLFVPPLHCGHLMAMHLIYLRACALSLHGTEASAQARQKWMVAFCF